MVVPKMADRLGSEALGARELSANFRALADATRLRIVRALWQQRDATVTDLCERLRISQPLMSWHLRILRRAGIVITYRSGRQVHCAVDERITAEYGALLAAFLVSDPELEATTAGVGSRTSEAGSHL